MKKLLSSVTLFALGAILFSSCSNSSKLAFTKRHYRNGYFVNHIGKVRTSINPSVATVPLKPEGNITSAPSTNSLRSSTIGTLLVSLQQSKIDENAVVVNKKIVVYPSIIYRNSNGVSLVKQSAKSNSDVTSSSSQGHHDSDNISVPYIVIVLCAIFIPPLGVGLMYGLNSYFWIDLILTLIFFFPGMLFALIVVLM